MGYNKHIWIAPEGDNLNRFIKENETANSVNLIQNPSLTNVPTPFSAEWMNEIEEGIETAHERLEAVEYASKPLLNEPFIVASNKRKVTVKGGTKVNLGEDVFYLQQDFELDIPTILDTGSITNGKDYYLHLIRGGNNLEIKASLNKEAPAGLNPSVAKKIGGFHTLCASASANMTYVDTADLGSGSDGTTKQHPLNGYVASDILPHSVWCLNHLPYSEPEGMVHISSLDFWCDIYLMSRINGLISSAYQGAIVRSRQYVDFVEDLFSVKKELLSDGEFAAAALGSNEQTAVAGSSEAGATNGGAGGRVDTANRRMISIYGCEEMCGSLWQWLRTTSTGGAAGSIYGQTAATPTYGWFDMTKTSYGPYGQSGGKGSFCGLAAALLAGGDWSGGAYCGSRARYANTARSNASTSFGGRGLSRPMRFIAY